jgi:2-polyprenyl-3-methyl-5-hydroxy-6-metoxy-1,4-benzoquinol methylase
MQAEDVDLLPAGSVGAIVLRSVLHHVLDVDAFLRDCARVLPAGGVLVCEEPCYEGYMLMGVLGQFIPLALERAGHPVSDEDRRHVSTLVATMQFYCRRDIDKSASEDKHLFRPDELTLTARTVGLELTHRPNWRLTATQEQNLDGRIGHFRRFMIDYLRYCMSWPADLAARTDEALREFLAFFDPIESREMAGAQCFGTFIFRRR